MTEAEHKLSQFADDTSLILDGKEKSLSEALAELDTKIRTENLVSSLSPLY